MNWQRLKWSAFENACLSLGGGGWLPVSYPSAEGSQPCFGWKPVLESLCTLVLTTGVISSVAATSHSAGRPHETGSGFLETWCWLLEWSSGQRVEWLDDRWPASMLNEAWNWAITELIKETCEGLAEVQLCQNIVQRAPHWRCAGPKPLFP